LNQTKRVIEQWRIDRNENKTISSRKKAYKESMRIQKKYFGKISKRWMLAYIKEIILGKSLKISDLCS